MKKFFLYLSAFALVGALALSCNKDPQNGDPDGPDGPDGPEVPSTEIYVSPEGAGLQDGSSAENAISWEDLYIRFVQAMTLTEVPEPEEAPTDADPDPVIAPAPDAPAYENINLVDGLTFIFADGTYTIPEEYVTLEGLALAFPAAPSPVVLTFKGSDKAVLSGNEASRVLTIGDQVDLTIEGMAIKDGKLEEKTYSGAGIYAHAAEEGKTTLLIKNTVFNNNWVNGDDSHLLSGGAIRCGNAEITIEGAVFEKDNYGRNGGSIYTDNANAKVTCKNCTFKSYSLNTGGASNNSKGEQWFLDCVFEGCYTEKGNGGAIHANAQGAVVKVDNCQFRNCKARVNDLSETSTSKDGGIISVQLADVTLDNCVFEGCEASSGALIFLQAGGSGAGTGGWFKCNNTKFINNIANDRGLIRVAGSKGNKQAAIGFFNNCLFYSNKMRTNQWGFILHGGNPGVACFNNFTIYGNERLQTGGNGVMLNTDGTIVFTNSTLIGDADLVSVRANDATNDTRVLLENSIIINTTETEGVDKAVVKPNTQKAPVYIFKSILGPVVNLEGVTATTTDSVTDATLATLTDGAFDTTAGVYKWSCPAERVMLTPDGFQGDVYSSLDVNLNEFNAYIGTKTLGQFWHDWLTDIGAIGTDATRSIRGAAWWPGAYDGCSNQ